MNTSDDFDKFLSRELANTRHHLLDEGFTDGVMASLPTTFPSSWRERLLVALPVLVIGLLVLAQVPLWETPDRLWQWYLAADVMTLIKTGAGVFGALLLACFGWLAREMELV